MKFTIRYTGQMEQGLLTSGRGENRWELNVMAALAADGHEVLIPGPHIPDKSLVPSNVRDNATLEEIKDSIYMCYSPAVKLLPLPPAKFYIINIYDSPGFTKVPDNSVVTQCYDTSGRGKQFKDKFGGKYHHLPHPAVPEIHKDKDNFHKKRITWTSRYMLTHHSGNREICKNAISWVSQKMHQDSELEFVFMSGEKDFFDTEKLFWENSYTNPLKKFQNRVIIKPEIPWGDLMSTLSETKLIINTGHFGHSFGGSPLEAASFGIPSVCFTINPFQDVREQCLIKGTSDATFTKKLEKLYTDHEYYKKIGSSYRDCVERLYTFSAFRQRLYAILRQNGINV